MDASTEASSLLAKLENYDFITIHKQFSDYLHPFSILISPKAQNPNHKPSNLEQSLSSDSSTIQSLAKNFLPFLNGSINLFNKRLMESPKHPKTTQFISQLLDAFKLCLDCLNSISSAIRNRRPYDVHQLRVMYFRCLLRWGRYEEAMDEGFRVLRDLAGVGVKLEVEGFSLNLSMGEYLPCLSGAIDNGNELVGGFAHLIVATAVAVVQCVSLSKTKDAGKYTAVLILLKEVQPWLRNLDPGMHSMRQWELSSYLKNTTTFLVREVNDLENDLVPRFFVATLREYVGLMNCQNQQELLGIHLLKLQTHFRQWPVTKRHFQRRTQEAQQKLVEFISDCGYNPSTCTRVRNALAKHLYEYAGNFCQDLAFFSVILRLYAMGLYLYGFNLKSDDCWFAKSGGSICTSSRFLPDVWDKLQDMSALLKLGKKFYCSNLDVCKKSLKCGCFVGRSSTCSNGEKGSQKCTLSSGDYISYLNALKFMCRPLAEFVNYKKRRMVVEEVDSPLGKGLKMMLEAFLEYCYLFPYCQKEKDAREEIDSIAVSISVAAFTLNLKLNFNAKGSKRFMNYLLSDECIPSLKHQSLKSMIDMLRHIFVEFYKGQLKQASKAVKLCCRASWSRCLHLCAMHVGKLKGFDGKLSETMIVDSVNEAFEFSHRHVLILHQIDSDKLLKVMLYGLENWCLARNLFEKIPCPERLLKCWVQIQCKLHEESDTNAPVLGSYLLNSRCWALTENNVLAETVGIILEQELSAYQEMTGMNTKISQRMQIEIIDALLDDVYNSEKWTKRSMTLVRKGVLLKSCKIGGLQNCRLCFSEAIRLIESVMSGSRAVTRKETASISCQLAVVYCLRALCTQEADPNSKQVFEDVRKAVSLWLRMNFPDCALNSQTDMGCEYVLLLLYHVADLLSIKGNVTLQLDVVRVMINILKWMDVPLEKCLSLLWGCRRLNHALCVLPINEAFIMALSESYGRDAESLDFWISSVKDSPALSVGLRQSFTCLYSLFPVVVHQLKLSLQADISVDEVKRVASHLRSNASNPGWSDFWAGCLFYDLSERLSFSGHMTEALLYAREALHLRGNLLHEYFSLSFEQHEDKHGESGQTVTHVAVSNQVVFRSWPSGVCSQDSDGYMLTPWNVLQCYLESALQVGIIHETLGNAADAESLFSIGKRISYLQSLPLFVIAFSTCLGKSYLGKNLSDLGQSEDLKRAEQVLAIERDSLTCSKCMLMLESTISEQLGNLYRKGALCATENPYESALASLIFHEKGDLAAWLEKTNSALTVLRNEVSIVAKSGTGTERKIADGNSSTLSDISNLSEAGTLKSKTEARSSRRAKRASESMSTDKCYAVNRDSRTTNARKLPCQSKKVGIVEGLKYVNISYSKGMLNRGVPYVSNMINCQNCFSHELRNLGSVTCFIRMKWEFVRRRQILRLLIGLGNCQGASTPTHRIYSKCISILVGGTDCECSSSLPLELDTIGKELKEVKGNVLAAEQAEVLYNLCWLSLKALNSKNTRSAHCDVCCIQMPQIVSLLKLSFVLSQEIPLLFQKVSTLLALVYILSSLKENASSCLSSSQVLAENYWAAYFHQASIGAYHNLRLLTCSAAKHKAQMASKIKGDETVLRGTATDPGTLFRRIVPASTEGLEACVSNFFESLPSATVVCMSLLGSSYTSLLEELAHNSSGLHGWMLLSHLNGDYQPAVVLLPLNSILQENLDEDTSSMCSIFGENNVLKEWQSPWGSSAVIDCLAPLFNMILRANYISSSSLPEEKSEKKVKAWWKERVRLDGCLRKLLRYMEESWFGPWKFLLLGRRLECEPLDSAVQELMHEIKVGLRSVVNESILKVVIGGIKSNNLEQERIPWHFLKKGCYISRVKDGDQDKCSSLDKAYDGADSVFGSLLELMVTRVNKLEAEYCPRREPIILVLDSDIQMLPWENMPTLREQEVYRMPSVASILLTLQRRSALEEAVQLAGTFPLIDPLDAFYLLNPSGDFSNTQTTFEDWFRFQNMQGKAGTVPSPQELKAALQNHELFLYFDHRSGTQYLRRDEIQKLENCAAALLMGCSSGSIEVHGYYAPTSTSISYILAGSPFVVGNLWEVTDGEIDRFARALLKSFVDERSKSTTGCIQCSLLAEEFRSMSVSRKQKENTKKGRGKKKAVEEAKPVISGGYCFRHKLRVAHFVSQARNACHLPFLTGAAPVCHGVPTGIKKKKDS